jgi:hypothetical protein
MLILTRHPGQLIALQPCPTLHPDTPIGRVFADGPIEILVTRVRGQQVSLGVAAHESLLIYRGEKEGVVPWRGEDAGKEWVFVSEVGVPFRSKRIIR